MKAERIQFHDISGILPPHPVISVAGAGGKTTLMFSLAKTLPETVVTTTTTKVGEKQILMTDQQLTLKAFPTELPAKSIWVSPSLRPKNGKIIGCNMKEFTQISRVCSDRKWSLIAETDGAARHHIKAPAKHEPVIPAECSVCFYLVGMDVLGLQIDEQTVHRPEFFCSITGLPHGSKITSNAIACLLDHSQGGLKGIPDNALRIAFLTHTDTKERYEAAQSIADSLLHYDYVCLN